MKKKMENELYKDEKWSGKWVRGGRVGSWGNEGEKETKEVKRDKNVE